VSETRRAFHEDLQELCTDVLHLAALATEAIQGGTAALLQADIASAEQLMSRDQEMDDLTHGIEQRACALLARQQPMAVDLRLIVTVLRVIHELERMGDLMVNIDKTIRRLGTAELGPKVRGLIEAMGQQATEQVQAASEAFEQRDTTLAGRLRTMDDAMDDLQRDLFRAIFAGPNADDAALQRAVQIALVGRYFERIGDHAVNVGERVEFMVNGRFPEMADAEPS
jgi:phosphate transport system protein